MQIGRMATMGLTDWVEIFQTCQFHWKMAQPPRTVLRCATPVHSAKLGSSVNQTAVDPLTLSAFWRPLLHSKAWTHVGYVFLMAEYRENYYISCIKYYRYLVWVALLCFFPWNFAPSPWGPSSLKAGSRTNSSSKQMVFLDTSLSSGPTSWTPAG